MKVVRVTTGMGPERSWLHQQFAGNEAALVPILNLLRSNSGT